MSRCGCDTVRTDPLTYHLAQVGLNDKSMPARGLESNVEFLGVEITSVLQTLLMAVSLLSAGLLVALVTVERQADSRRARVVLLEPARTPGPLPVVSRRPSRRHPVHPGRAPPVSPQRGLFKRADHLSDA